MTRSYTDFCYSIERREISHFPSEHEVLFCLALFSRRRLNIHVCFVFLVHYYHYLISFAANSSCICNTKENLEVDPSKDRMDAARIMRALMKIHERGDTTSRWSAPPWFSRQWACWVTCNSEHVKCSKCCFNKFANYPLCFQVQWKAIEVILACQARATSIEVTGATVSFRRKSIFSTWTCSGCLAVGAFVYITT